MTQTRRAATTAVGRKRVQSGGTLQGHVHTSFIHGFMNERLRACACACAPTEGVACAVASDMTAVAVPIEEGEQQRACVYTRNAHAIHMNEGCTVSVYTHETTRGECLVHGSRQL